MRGISKLLFLFCSEAIFGTPVNPIFFWKKCSIFNIFLESFCLLPKDPGPCQNNGTLVVRYGYNPATDSCKDFQYSGCGGNLNNFNDLQTCTNICCNKGYNFALTDDAVEYYDEESPSRSSEGTLSEDSLLSDSVDSVTDESSLVDGQKSSSWWRKVMRFFRS